ncbi:MAG: hypothetical protein ACMG6E_02665 [Candidatus Roizmanbacteria bacterium]
MVGDSELLVAALYEACGRVFPFGVEVEVMQLNFWDWTIKH